MNKLPSMQTVLFIFFAFMSLICLLLLKFQIFKSYESLLTGIFLSGLTAIVSIVYNFMIDINKERLPFIFSLKLLLFKNSMVRASIAYLYRIKINDRYLLITNLKHGTIAPIGGVYKMYDRGKTLLDDLKIRDSESFEKNVSEIQNNDKTNVNRYKNDLRLKMPAKHFKKFMKWYYSGNGIEYCPLREFYEELFESETNDDAPVITEKELFTTIECSKYKKTQRPKPVYDQKRKFYRFYQFDIFSIELNEDQQNYLLKRMEELKIKKSKMQLYLVSIQDIEDMNHLGISIGKNTTYII
jgi:hypothetical protein